MGVIKALSEAGIKPAIISGVSAGAIIGAFIARGFPPDEVLEIILKTSLFKFMRPGFSRTGLLKLERAEQLLRQYFKDTTFENLNTPLIVSALDINKGKITYFNSGDLVLPILASSSIPVIFNPIKINGASYVDGGLFENLPIAPLKGHCNFIIGVHTNPINDAFEPASIKSFVERIFLLAINGNARPCMKEADFIIEPEGLKHIKWSSYSKAKVIFEIGYEHTYNILPKLQELLMAQPT